MERCWSLAEQARLESVCRLCLPWVRIPPSPHLICLAFNLLVALDGEVAVPCNSQSAIARSKARNEALFCGACLVQVVRTAGSCAREPVNPVRPGREQR